MSAPNHIASALCAEESCAEPSTRPSSHRLDATLIILLGLLLCLTAFAQPLPPGAARSASTFVQPPATNPPYRSAITLIVEPYTPQISMVKFYSPTHVFRYRLEQSADLRTWRPVEGYSGTNDYSRQIPQLRDQPNLVTWLLVQPGRVQQFYRLTILP